MKLYGAQRAVNPRRARIFIAEKGIQDIEHIHLDLFGGENLKAEFTAKNPFTTVPVLELEDGTYIPESIAICRYLEALYPEPNLFGLTPRETADIEGWTRIIEYQAQVPASMAFRHTSGVFADREAVVKEWGEVSRERLLKNLKRFDQRLAGREFVAANRYTIADVCLTCAMDQATNSVKVELDPAIYGNLLNWYARVKQRPSYVA